MTRNRVPYLGIAAIAAATLLSPDVHAQAGRATLIGAPSGQQFCNYSNIATQPSGQVDITCGVVTPGAVGTVGFTATSYPAVTKDTATNATVNVSIQRVGGSTGAVDATLNANGPCTPTSQPVRFNDGVLGSVSYVLNGTAVGVCGLQLTAITATATPGIVTSAVEVTAAPPAGGGGSGITPPAGCPAVPINAVLETMGGKSANQYVTDTARSDGLATIHVYPMPKQNGVQVSTGIFSFTTNTTATPTSLRVDVSLSRCPGDVAFWRSAAGVVNMYGKDWHPCGNDGTGEQAGVRWNVAPGSFYECPIPAGQDWFLNVRYTDSSGNYTCPSGRSCGQVFNWNGQ